MNRPLKYFLITFILACFYISPVHGQLRGSVGAAGLLNLDTERLGFNGRLNVQMGEHFWIGPQYSYYSWVSSSSWTSSSGPSHFNTSNSIQLNLTYLYEVPIRMRIETYPIVGIIASSYSQYTMNETFVDQYWSMTINLGAGLQTKMSDRLALFLDYVFSPGLYHEHNMHLGLRLYWGEDECDTCDAFGN